MWPILLLKPLPDFIQYSDGVVTQYCQILQNPELFSTFCNSLNLPLFCTYEPQFVACIILSMHARPRNVSVPTVALDCANSCSTNSLLEFRQEVLSSSLSLDEERE
jgi:hypothetical protein